jgi:hypothetical protein
LRIDYLIIYFNKLEELGIIVGEKAYKVSLNNADNGQ